ncbi:MAG TPA: serine/threonine-protein kinase, partial [Candidatus Acidoferrum sp.]|nr:serine/threonine-protein kinase [Candidatus Acidoferrum sp.]
MDCPQCHSSNPATALRCAKCATPLPGAGRKVVGQTVATPPPDPDAVARIEKGTSANLKGTPLAGNTSTPEDLESSTLAGQSKRPPPADPNVTLLDEATSASGIASGWAVPATAGSTGVYAASLAALQSGALLGDRYEIIRQLGQGGMGAVYQARDREVDRMVALKVIRPELAGQPEILQRFKQELILARQVTHRNVIRIFDLGEAGGIKFITMEYIVGRDLRSLLIEKGKLPPAEAVAIIEQVSLALEAAHGEGVVHRDLKPQNIVVNGDGKVCVMDFGIARSIELEGMTRTGALVGTPEYMSPEQVQGEKA